MPSQMAHYSGFPFFFKITIINWTVVKTCWTVKVKEISVNKFYLANSAGERPGVHPVDVQKQLACPSDPKNSTMRASKSFPCQLYCNYF